MSMSAVDAINVCLAYPLRQECADAAWHLLNVRNGEIIVEILKTRDPESITRLSALCREADDLFADNKTRLVRHVDVYPNGREVIVFEGLRSE